MARKSNWYVRSKFSHRNHRILDLNFTFWHFFPMTHTYDVINLWYKKGMQKLRKMSPAETISSFEILILAIVYLLKYREPYFFLFSRMFKEEQEIVHMIKRGQNVSRGYRCNFFFVFPLCTSLIKIWITLFHDHMTCHI